MSNTKTSEDELMRLDFEGGIKNKNPKYRVCLNMIVKNETKVMPRLISTVKDFIDYYIISDTGSSDGTIELIKDEMKKYGIPGEIHENPWKNFAHNREVALRYVYLNGNCEYLMTIDADEEFRYGKSVEEIKTKFASLDKDVYHVKKKFMGNEYYIPFLLRTTKVKWNWRGPVHNYIDLIERKGETTHEYVDGDEMWIHVNYHEGSKSHDVSSKEKYMRDAKVLEEEVKKDPTDSRSQFYLAQSYYDAEEWQLAYAAYDKRTKMGGWNEEIFYSKFKMGVCAIRMAKTHGEIVELLLDAYEYRPSRIEPLFQLTKYCEYKKFYHQGYMFGKMAMELPISKDLLFVDQNVYKYALADHYSLCAYYSGHYEESKDILLKLLKSKQYPERFEERYKSNLRYALNGIKSQKEQELKKRQRMANPTTIRSAEN